MSGHQRLSSQTPQLRLAARTFNKGAILWWVDGIVSVLVGHTQVTLGRTVFEEIEVATQAADNANCRAQTPGLLLAAADSGRFPH